MIKLYFEKYYFEKTFCSKQGVTSLGNTTKKYVNNPLVQNLCSEKR